VRKIHATKLQAGDTLVGRNADEPDSFVILPSATWEHWDVLVLATDYDGLTVRGQPYHVGCVMRAWIHWHIGLSGDYDVYRDGSLVSESW
jgi:hypothetical protein